MEKVLNFASNILTATWQFVLTGLDWLMGAYAIIVFVIFFALLILFGVLSLVKRKNKGAGSKKGARKSSHPAPVIVVHTTDSHHASGGSHGHISHGASHHGKPERPLYRTIVYWVLAVFLLLAFWWAAVTLGLVQIPSVAAEPSTRRAAMRLSATQVSSTQVVCTPVPSEWEDVTAPPESEGEKSRVLRPPPCHRFWFCDKKRDPKCEATSFADARFTLWCTTPEHSTAQLYDHKRDVIIEGCQVQSKGAMPIELKFKSEFSPPA